MNLLELFKGTGSVGKVAKKLGFEIVSFDIDPNAKPDIVDDILDWNYMKFYKETGFVPDFIWASPPCNTFSPLVYRLKERNPKSAVPYSDRAKLGTKILYKTLEIIAFFHKLNPDLKFVIENPKGMMRNDKYMKKIPRYTTMYCLYNDKRRKQTDFWSNFTLNLKSDSCCPYPTVQIHDIPLNERYKIPPKLIEQIFDDYFKSQKLDGAGFMDFIRNPIATIKEALLPIPSKLNNISSRTLQQYGSNPVQSIVIIRTPVHSLLIGAIDMISRGTFQELLKKYGYDKLFHLAIIVKVNNQTIIVEKNEVVNIAPFSKSNVNQKTEYLEINPGNTTLTSMMDKTLKYMGPQKFYDYSALHNNCQNFIYSILYSNGLLNNQSSNFIFQDMSGIVKDLNSSGKSYVSKVLDGITSIGSKFSRLIAKGEEKPGIVQAIIFEKNKWTVKDARKELKHLGFKLLKGKKVHVTGDTPEEGYIRFRIQEPDYERYNYRIIWFSKKDGIRAIYGFPI